LVAIIPSAASFRHQPSLNFSRTLSVPPRLRLSLAAKAPQACARADSISEGIKVSMEIEQPRHL